MTRAKKAKEVKYVTASPVSDLLVRGGVPFCWIFLLFLDYYNYLRQRSGGGEVGVHGIDLNKVLYAIPF